MRRHAKAPSAGSTSDRESDPASIRRALVIRGASPAFKGSGARSSGHLPRVAIALSLIALLAAALLPSAASAAQTRAQLGFSPIDGSGTGVTFGSMSGIGIDESNGNIFVNDGYGNLTNIFSGTGGVPAGVASPYNVTGFAFYGSQVGAAVDNSATSPSKGTLYITDLYNYKVKKFTLNVGTEKYEAAGELTPTSGGPFQYPTDVAVDNDGNVYVSDLSSHSIIKFGPTGTQLARINTEPALGSPLSIAVDNAHDVFLSQYYRGKVVKYPANGLGEIEAGTFTQVVPSSAETVAIAMDSGTNKLFIASNDHVSEFNAATLAKGLEFGSGEITSAYSIDVNSAAGRIYVGDNGEPRHLLVFGGVVTVPNATSGGVDRNLTSATLHGTVNPDGVSVTDCYFETTTEAEFTEHGFKTGATKIPCTSSPGGGSSPVAVQATVTGLSPSSNYRFRLIAANANGKVAGSPIAFTTLGPQIKESFVSFPSMTDTTATLKAKVNPGGEGTTYYYEYVTAKDYEETGFAGASKAPSGITGVGHGTDDVDIAPVLEGLQPATPYRARLVLINPSGTATGPTLSFATFPRVTLTTSCPNTEFRDAPSNRLPDCRAYEQATPVGKNGGNVMGAIYHTAVALDGNAVFFQVNSGIPGGTGATEFGTYVSRRPSDPEGNWSTLGTLVPPHFGERGSINAFTPDLKYSFINSAHVGVEQTNVQVAHNMVTNTFQAVYPEQPSFGSVSYAGASEDDSKIFFERQGNQLPVTSGVPPAPGVSNVYVWEPQTEQLSVAAVLPAGEGGVAPTTGASVGPPGGALAENFVEGHHAMSTDGDKLFFSTAESKALYLRRGLNGGSPETIKLSKSLKDNGVGPGGTQPNSPGPTAFQAATPDGSVAFFTSHEELTNESNTGPEPSPPVVAIGRADIGGTNPNLNFVPVDAKWTAVDAGHIYWSNNATGTIGRAEIGGGNPEPNLITGLDHVEGLAVDSGHIYWAEARDGSEGGGTIGRATTTGGTVEKSFITGASDPKDVAVSATYIYWTNGVTTDIGRATILGASPEQSFLVRGGGEHPWGIDVNATNLYWVDQEGSPYIIKMNVGGGGETYTSFQGTMRGLTIDSNYIYWSDPTNARIGRLHFDFSGREEEFIPNIEGIFGIAVDAGHVYWAANPAGGPKPSPGNDLYSYNTENEELTDLTIDNSDVNGAEVQGVVGVSDEGNRVYFVANGDLDGGGQATHGDCKRNQYNSPVGSCNLYLWEGGEITFVAPMSQDTNDQTNWKPSSAAECFSAECERPSGFVSANGEAVVFWTANKLTSYDNQGVREFYRYHVGDPAPICISCSPTGAPAGSSGLTSISGGAAEFSSPQPFLYHNLSADGNRFFFETTQKLVPEDTNGDVECPYSGGFTANAPTCQDVYMWEADKTGSCRAEGGFGGCFYLMSTGKEANPVFLSGASVSGRDVFFYTHGTLVPQDQDELTDIYDARTEGGLAAQHAVIPPTCEGEACRGAGTTPPPTNGAGSAVFVGPENPQNKHKKPKKPHKKHHKKHRGKRSHGRTGHNRGGSK